MALGPGIIEIDSADVISQQRVVNGSAVTFRHQMGYLRMSERESVEVELPLGRDMAPRAPGKYYIGARSFDRDDYHRVKLAKLGLELIPVPAGAKL